MNWNIYDVDKITSGNADQFRVSISGPYSRGTVGRCVGDVWGGWGLNLGNFLGSTAALDNRVLARLVLSSTREHLRLPGITRGWEVTSNSRCNFIFFGVLC